MLEKINQKPQPQHRFFDFSNRNRQMKNLNLTFPPVASTDFVYKRDLRKISEFTARL
jgi:hypothetical protein